MPLNHKTSVSKGRCQIYPIFFFRLENLHLLPRDELCRRIIFEITYLGRADSLAEEKMLLALDKYGLGSLTNLYQ
jgi:hypothetical protein